MELLMGWKTEYSKTGREGSILATEVFFFVGLENQDTLIGLFKLAVSKLVNQRFVCDFIYEISHILFDNFKQNNISAENTFIYCWIVEMNNQQNVVHLQNQTIETIYLILYLYISSCKSNDYKRKDQRSKIKASKRR